MQPDQSGFVERIHYTIEDRFYTLETPFSCVLPRVGNITLFPGGGFKKTAYVKFKERTMGELEYSIQYGHPDGSYCRRSKKELKLDVFKHDKGTDQEAVTVNWTIKQETDTAI